MKNVILDTNAIDEIHQRFPDLNDKAQRLGYNLVTLDIQWTQIRNIPEDNGPGLRLGLLQVINNIHTAVAVGVIPGLSNPRWSIPVSGERIVDFLGNKELTLGNQADAVVGLTSLDSQSILVTNDRGLTKTVVDRGGSVYTPENFDSFLDSKKS